MKTLITLIASILFATLFYHQHIGLNLTVFSILTMGVLVLSHPNKLKLQPNLILLTMYMLTAVLVFVNHSSLSITANCAVFFTLVGSFSESKSSMYIKWLNGLYSSIAGMFHRKFEAESNENHHSIKKSIDVWHTVKIIVIPLIIVVLFTVLYKNGNPLFESIISAINFDFINLQWMLFCVLGYYLFGNILIPVQVQPATETDLSTGNQLQATEPLNLESLKKEKQLAIILMSLLNLLILVYIISDIAYLLSNNNFAASVLSNQVHNGINTLILSILFAISILLYFFRGNLNFFNENKRLKQLSYTWIFLNALLVVLILLKNTQYVNVFGLTYKRVGVYLYLLMTLVGLITTFLKVFHVQNLWFLFRKNVSVAFLLLIFCSAINWDSAITDYNIEHADSLDIDYLIHLSDNNAFTLYEKRGRMLLTSNQKVRIASKYTNYRSRLIENSWQEYSYDNFKLNENIASHEGTK